MSNRQFGEGMQSKRALCAYTVLILVLLGSFSTHAKGQVDNYALTGTIVTPRGVVPNGTMLIAHGVIQGLGADIPIPKSFVVVKTDGVIFPGLIDLHNHLTWNIFPRWSPGPAVGNRYDWQAMKDYSAKLSNPQGLMVDRGLGCEMERYAEVKALFGGATSVVGSFGPTPADSKRNECDRGLARNLDFISGLYSSDLNAEPLEYDVFPFEIPYSKLQGIRDAMNSGKLKSLLIHVSEGKDASAAREFRMLKAIGLLRPGVTVIHGVALQGPQLLEMAGNGVGLVWSPRSNFSLYDATVDIASAKNAGIVIAIAPDWSPSGSSGMLEEIRYAYKWNLVQSPKPLEDSDFLKMATSNAARLSATDDKIGVLAVGMAADVIVLPKRGESPAMALLDAQPGNIELVVVGGRPLLGSPDLMRQLVPESKLEALKVCNFERRLNIRDDTGGESWSEIEARLTAELQKMQIALSGLADCQ